jgi:hypothetical protein
VGKRLKTASHKKLSKEVWLYQEFLKRFEDDIYLKNSYYYRKIDKYKEQKEVAEMKAELYLERNSVLEKLLLQLEMDKLKSKIN